MSEFVALAEQRHRGWPWPDDSWGLTPMFGEDGWCRSCAVPRHAQTGSIILRRTNLTVTGAWVPNWQFNAMCFEQSVGARLAARYQLDLIPVAWPATPSGDAVQVVIPSVGEQWFDPADLEARPRHGRTGARCDECGVWKWLPFLDPWPPLRIEPSLRTVDVAASPEWFGGGMRAFRRLLFRRELAEEIVKASPRDFKLQEVPWAD